MIKFKFLIVILLLITSCKSNSEKNYRNQPEYVRLAYEIMQNTANELQNAKKLKLVGFGGGMMYEIENLHLSFLSFDNQKLFQARDLIVFSIRLFLKNINTNEKIRPYLKSYPFTSKNISIFINIQNADTSINGVALTANKIVYDVPGKEKTFEQIHEETYEEALKIVESEKSTNG